LESNKEKVESGGAISKHASPKSNGLKPESAKSGQQGTDLEEKRRSLTKSRLGLSVNELTEDELSS